jgi:hypothetical protein
MSAIADIAVYDGAATPVLHTLKAVSVSRDKETVTALWREDAAGVPTNAQVRAQLTLTKNPKTGLTRSDMRVVVPVQEVVTGANASGYSAAPKVAYENTLIITGIFSERSDSAGRRLARQLAVNIAGNISTSVAATSNGPLPEAFDTLRAPT